MLVLVSGAPASGKSTLAALLAREEALGLPLLSRDAVAAGLTDTLGIRAGDPRWADAVLRPSGDAFFGGIGFLLSAGVGVIAEQAFYRGADDHHLASLGVDARVALIHCALPAEEGRRRFLARARARWPDGALPVGMRVMVDHMERGAFDWSPYGPPALPAAAARTLTVDTSSGYAPDLTSIVAFIRHPTWPAARG